MSIMSKVDKMTENSRKDFVMGNILRNNYITLLGKYDVAHRHSPSPSTLRILVYLKNISEINPLVAYVELCGNLTRTLKDGRVEEE
jgi:hypothetical protein